MVAAVFRFALVGWQSAANDAGPLVGPLILLLALTLSGCSRPAPRIELAAADSPGGQTIEVAGLGEAELAAVDKLDPAASGEVLQVFVAGDLANPPPIQGTVTREGNALRFTPRYPLEPGLRYRAVLHRAPLSPGAKANDDLVAELRVPPRPERPATRIARIYPTSDRLPENQLKFYIHFSAPMGRGDAYRHIHLLDADGKELEATFLELDEELWDRDLLRFTLLCDPGRVKRGLKPREDLGPVLEAGRRYTLVIDADWPDAQGAALQEGARKSFEVLPSDEAPLDAALWKLEPPPADTSDALAIRFPEPLDHALAERMLSITNAGGAKISGNVDITDGETCWRFTPARPWAAGAYYVVADTALEDLAGNSIGRAFDVDLQAPAANTPTGESISIPFTIEAAR